MSTMLRLRLLLTLLVLAALAAGAGAWEVTGPGSTSDQDKTVHLPASAAVLWSPSELAEQTNVRLIFQARHVQGTGLLLLGTTPAAAVPAVQVPADGKVHRVELRLLRPAGASLCLAVSQGDEWTLSDLRVDRWTPEKIERLWPSEKVPPPLPADWQPAGTLDARPLMIGREQRLRLDVGSLRIILPGQAEALRGRRDEFRAQTVNTADGKVKVTISLQGPPWVSLPSMTIPIRAQEQMLLRPQITSFWAGETWAKLVFESSGAQAAMPVRIKCSPAYPAFGVFLPPAASVEDLQAALKSPMSLVFAPAALVVQVELPSLGPEVLPYGSVEELTHLAGQTASPLIRLACLWAPPAQWAEKMKALAASEQVKQRKWLLAAGPLPVALGARGLETEPGAVEAAAAVAKVTSLACVVAQAPPIPTIEVAQSSVDGKPDDQMPYWQALARRYDPAPLRAQLTQKGLRLPIAWVDLRTAGDEKSSPLGAAWAVAAGGLTYQGATAICARWPAPGDNLLAWSATARELAAAVPLLGPIEHTIGDTSAGHPVVYKPFLRGREGALVLTNTSARTREIAVEIAAEPLAACALRVAPGSQPRRQWTMPFRFEDYAFKLGRPLVFFKLLPAETVVLNLRMVDAHPRWLKSVERRPPEAPKGPKPEWAKPRGWFNALRKRAHELRMKEERERERSGD